MDAVRRGVAALVVGMLAGSLVACDVQGLDSPTTDNDGFEELIDPPLPSVDA